MKILGKVEDYGFILQISIDEMVNLLGGNYGKHSDEFAQCVVGRELKINKMYANAREILASYQEIKSCVNSLKTNSTKILNFVDMKENPVAAISKE